ncbi:MAG TPA: transglycosylase SLT domain-containing protein [Alphaproteobacteria bacterium]|nr:transglycosylase SLT domain-containing protein [Alphaproteobacteria bacterium]
MNSALKSLENNALAALTSRAPQGIVNAIRTASAKTGVSFSYLMQKAAAESNFNPTIKAKTSSATGLFQFIESTWMDMVKKYGEKYGIDTTQNKATLLNLRKDPEIASLMAAEFAQGNQDYLEQTVGGTIGNTELYFAHFMGAGGASAFLSQLKKNPLATAADLFPKEALANRGVFYDPKTGSPRTLQQVYDFFDNKFSTDDRTVTPKTILHKSSTSHENGYQHIPFSLKKPVEILGYGTARSANSLYQIQNQVDAFFATPASLSNINSLYGEMRNPASILLDILR